MLYITHISFFPISLLYLFPNFRSLSVMRTLLPLSGLGNVDEKGMNALHYSAKFKYFGTYTLDRAIRAVRYSCCFRAGFELYSILRKSLFLTLSPFSHPSTLPHTCTDILRYLVPQFKSQPALLNHQSLVGNTPLMEAIEAGSADAALELIAAGADVNIIHIPDKVRLYPIDITRDECLASIIFIQSHLVLAISCRSRCSFLLFPFLFPFLFPLSPCTLPAKPADLPLPSALGPQPRLCGQGHVQGHDARG